MGKHQMDDKFVLDSGNSVIIGSEIIITINEEGVEHSLPTNNIQRFSYRVYAEPKRSLAEIMWVPFIGGLFFVVYPLLGGNIQFPFIVMCVGVIGYLFILIDYLFRMNMVAQIMAPFTKKKGYVLTFKNRNGEDVLLKATYSDYYKIQQIGARIERLKNELSTLKTASGNSTDKLDRLNKLNELYKEGVLTEVEFNKLKSEII